MGTLLRQLEQLDEANRLGTEAVETAKRVLPEEHWYTAIFLGEHARTLTAIDRFAESEERLLEAVAIFESALGPQHNRTIGNIRAIAGLYERWHEAEPDAGHDAKAAQWRAKLEDSPDHEGDD